MIEPKLGRSNQSPDEFRYRASSILCTCQRTGDVFLLTDSWPTIEDAKKQLVGKSTGIRQLGKTIHKVPPT